MFLHMLVIFVWICQVFSELDPDESYHKEVQLEGQIPIGGLFAIHGSIRGSQLCAEDIIMPEFVIGAEATIFSIKRANANLTADQLTLGFSAFDTCSMADIGYERALKWAKADKNDTERPLLVTGSLGSDTAVAISILLQSAEIPMLSQHSSYDLLSTLGLKPMFFQMSPPNQFQAIAILTLLVEMKWNSIILVVGDDRDSVNLADKIRYLHTEVNSSLCIEYEISLSLDRCKDKAKMEIEWIRTLQGVIVVLANREYADYFFTMLKECQWAKDFQYVGSNSLTHNDNLKFPFLVNAIAVTSLYEIVPEFSTHLRQLNFSSAYPNIWMQQLIAKQNNCCISNCPNDTACVGHEQLIEVHTVGENVAYLAMKSVEVIAKALLVLQQSLCQDSSNQSDCIRRLMSLPGTVINQSLGAALNETNLSKRYPYITFSYVKLNETSRMWDEIGSYNAAEKLFQMPNSKVILSKSVRQRWANCRLPCNEIQKTTPVGRCCYNCTKCTDEQVIVVHRNCAVCKDSPMINDSCVSYDPIAVNLQDTCSVSLLALSFVGCLISVFVVSILILNRKSPFMEAIFPIATLSIGLAVVTMFCTPILFILIPHYPSVMCASMSVSYAAISSFVWGILFFKTFYNYRLLRRLNWLQIFEPPVTSANRHFLWFSPVVFAVTIGCMLAYFKLIDFQNTSVEHIFLQGNIWISCPVYNHPEYIVSIVPSSVLCLATTCLAICNRDSQIWIYRFEAQLICSCGLFTTLFFVVMPYVTYTIDHAEHRPVITLVNICMGPSIHLITYLIPIVFNLLFRKKRNTRLFIYHSEIFKHINGKVFVVVSLDEWTRRNSA